MDLHRGNEKQKNTATDNRNTESYFYNKAAQLKNRGIQVN